MEAKSRFLKIVQCPRCGQSVVVDSRHRHYVDSVQRIGCDDCLRKLARVYFPSAVLARFSEVHQAA